MLIDATLTCRGILNIFQSHLHNYLRTMKRSYSTYWYSEYKAWYCYRWTI